MSVRFGNINSKGESVDVNSVVLGKDLFEYTKGCGPKLFQLIDDVGVVEDYLFIENDFAVWFYSDGSISEHLSEFWDFSEFVEVFSRKILTGVVIDDGRD